jgi:hypothetical protein
VRIGRGLDHADVTETGERHVEGARNRSRGEREDVDLEAKLAEELLLGDAEALLLVDDHETEVLGDHVAGEDAVGPDEDVDLALRKVAEDGLHLRGPSEARDHFDANGEVAVALPEGVPVLLREDGRRGEQQGLLPLDGHGEGGANGDLGLAEPDVAADEPIHRARRLQVLLHGLDRTLLVGRLLVREGGLQLLQEVAVDAVADPLGALAARVEGDELTGELAGSGAGP